MPYSPNTGPTAPAWIRDRIALYEQAWPLGTLGAGILASIVVDVALGVLLWTADSVVYYARPLSRAR
jgi:hypothetical protein